ncbi:MAG TPA: thioredoxin domain-containing protein, partial [Chitinophagaceae bacterium]|nr:thioredoxin domain-containing protein [Chitinophagaceae bacterium]
MSKFTNKLADETSPYLLQHAHNPVNWYPWGDEALQKANEEDKPILVSIGYSACHWCHVMEHESFEDEKTAELMNNNFINIKIDREERPDLDHIYMDAVQAIAGNGGWPLNVFLTPGKKPFYGGTYFPPQRAFNRSSWKEVLLGVSNLFKEKRQEIEAQAEELTQHIGRSNINPLAKTFAIDIGEGLFTKEQCEEIFSNIMRQADKKWGGFGNAPKFPQTFTINYLLRYYHYTKNEDALKHACLSLDKMIQGGIYDQVGGGFARYSTDVEWLAPHFEKMLYDNSLLIRTLSDAYQVTKNASYKKTIEQTIHFIERELADVNGGFYSALDADSEGEEGKFYVWSYEEVNKILGDEAELFCEYYDITENGNWEHKNILRVLIPLKKFATQKNLNEEEITIQLKSSEEKLLQERGKRIRPLTDDKILLGWNALMITALCKAAAALSITGYKELAVKNFEFIFAKFKVRENDFEFYHTYKQGVAKYPAFLDDYACLIEACISLQEITSDNKYIEYARSLTDYVLENFSSSNDDFFYYSGKKQTDVIVRKKEIYDGAVASGNSVMAFNLFYLSVILDNPLWKQKAVTFLNSLSELIIKYPTSFGNWASLLIDVYADINEIAISGNGFEELRDELLGYFFPNKVLQCTNYPNENKYPLIAQKSVTNQPLVYLCRNYTCLAPVENIPSIINQIVNNG